MTPSVEQEGWFGLFAAAGTPAEVVKRLNGHLNQALADPTVRSGREHRYVEVGTPGGPDRFRSCVAKEATHWSKVVADSGVKAEQVERAGSASASDPRRADRSDGVEQCADGPLLDAPGD